LRAAGDPIRIAEPCDRRAASPIVVAFGSDQGFCGQFISRLAQFLETRIDGGTDENAVSDRARSRPAVFEVCRRLAAALRSRGHDLAAEYDVPQFALGITSMALTILDELQRRHPLTGVRIGVFHHRPLEGAAYEPYSTALLPLDLHWLNSLRVTPWPTRQSPWRMENPGELFTHLVQRYFFIVFVKTLTESLAAENTARLAAMQSAERSIDDQFGLLQ
jgi:F-type H+-transporting ATPase subunit gamma